MISSKDPRRFGLSQRGRRALRLALPVFLLMLLLRLTGLIEPIGLAIYDAFNRLSVGPTSERVVVIGFGETDFAKYPDYPFSDALLAEVLNRVDAGKPRAVLLNLLRDVPVQTGHEALLERYRAMPNLYGLAAITPLAREDVPAPPVLRDSGRFGFVQSMPDTHDDVTRMTLLGFRQGEVLLESVLLKVVRAALDGKVAIDDRNRLVLGDRQLPAVSESFGEYQPRLGKHFSGESELGEEQLLAYSLPFRSANIPVINFAEVLSPEFDTRRLENRVVLIGNSSLSLQRAMETPLTATQGRGLSGVEFNAALIDNILAYSAGQGLGLRSLPEWIEYLLLFVVSWLAVWRFMVYRSLWTGIARGSVLLALVAIAGYGAFQLGWWLPLGAIGVTLVGAVLVVVDNLLRAAAGQERIVGFMDQIFDRLPEPMFVLDHNHEFRLVNEGFSRLAGTPPVELVGQSASRWLSDQSSEGKARLNAHGRLYELALHRSNMADEHGRPLTLGLVRSASPVPGEPGAEAHRLGTARTALWWAARGRGALLVASIRVLDAELVDQALGSNSLPRVERALMQRLRSAFPDAIDLWLHAPGQLLFLLARDGAFDDERLRQLLRQSFSWALRIDDEALELDVAVGVAIGRDERATLDALIAQAQSGAEEMAVG